MRIKLSKFEWERIGVESGWIKSSQTNGAIDPAKWKDITSTYSLVYRIMKAKDAEMAYSRTRIKELKNKVEEIALSSEGQRIGSAFQEEMSKAAGTLNSVERFLSKAYDSAMAGDKNSEGENKKSAEEALALSYTAIMSAHKLYVSSQGQEMGKQASRGPCWRGYKQVGMKKKNGRMVPNCVKSNKNK